MSINTKLLFFGLLTLLFWTNNSYSDDSEDGHHIDPSNTFNYTNSTLTNSSLTNSSLTNSSDPKEISDVFSSDYLSDLVLIITDYNAYDFLYIFGNWFEIFKHVGMIFYAAYTTGTVPKAGFTPSHAVVRYIYSGIIFTMNAIELYKHAYHVHNIKHQKVFGVTDTSIEIVSVLVEAHAIHEIYEASKSVISGTSLFSIARDLGALGATVGLLTTAALGAKEAYENFSPELAESLKSAQGCGDVLRTLKEHSIKELTENAELFGSYACKLIYRN